MRMQTRNRTREGGRRALGLLVLLWAAAVSPSARQETGATLLERTVVLGASLSDGFNLKPELKASADFADVLAAQRSSAHPWEAVHSGGDATFFLDPIGTGRGQIAEAKKVRPTLVIAVDFLFWFAYGHQPEAQRETRLEEGFAFLETFGCPLVVGDLPDVSKALDGEGFLGQPMVVAAQVPTPATLAKLNERIADWAAARGDVLVIPLAATLERMHSGEAIELHGRTFTGGSKRFLQADLLHPSVDGALLVGLLVWDVLERERDEVAEEDVRWSLEDGRQGLLERTAQERAKALEREARREERRRKRAERTKEPAECGG